MSHCMDQAANDKAKKVVQACEAKWPANKADCNAFLKAVATELAITGITGNADSIVNWLEGTPGGWTKLARGEHQSAHERANEGRFVVAGLLSSDMGRPEGHVAVVTCGNREYSGADAINYPRGYWGTLGAEGDQCKGMNYSFPAPARKDLRYYWIDLPERLGGERSDENLIAGARHAANKTLQTMLLYAC